MTCLSQIWICGSLSEVVRADHLVSLFVSDGTPDGNRVGETNQQGVLWAYVVGRAEPVRLDGFTGITTAELLDAITKAISDVAVNSDGPVTYIRLHHTGGRASVTSVKVYSSFPLSDGLMAGQR